VSITQDASEAYGEQRLNGGDLCLPLLVFSIEQQNFVAKMTGA